MIIYPYGTSTFVYGDEPLYRNELTRFVRILRSLNLYDRASAHDEHERRRSEARRSQSVRRTTDYEGMSFDIGGEERGGMEESVEPLTNGNMARSSNPSKRRVPNTPRSGVAPVTPKDISDRVARMERALASEQAQETEIEVRQKECDNDIEDRDGEQQFLQAQEKSSSSTPSSNQAFHSSANQESEEDYAINYKHPAAPPKRGNLQ